MSVLKATLVLFLVICGASSRNPIAKESSIQEAVDLIQGIKLLKHEHQQNDVSTTRDYITALISELKKKGVKLNDQHKVLEDGSKLNGEIPAKRTDVNKGARNDSSASVNFNIESLPSILDLLSISQGPILQEELDPIPTKLKPKPEQPTYADMPYIPALHGNYNADGPGNLASILLNEPVNTPAPASSYDEVIAALANANVPQQNSVTQSTRISTASITTCLKDSGCAFAAALASAGAALAPFLISVIAPGLFGRRKKELISFLPLTQIEIKQHVESFADFIKANEFKIPLGIEWRFFQQELENVLKSDFHSVIENTIKENNKKIVNESNKISISESKKSELNEIILGPNFLKELKRQSNTKTNIPFINNGKFNPISIKKLNKDNENTEVEGKSEIANSHGTVNQFGNFIDYSSLISNMPQNSNAQEQDFSSIMENFKQKLLAMKELNKVGLPVENDKEKLLQETNNMQQLLNPKLDEVQYNSFQYNSIPLPPKPQEKQNDQSLGDLPDRVNNLYELVQILAQVVPTTTPAIVPPAPPTTTTTTTLPPTLAQINIPVELLKKILQSNRLQQQQQQQYNPNFKPPNLNSMQVLSNLPSVGLHSRPSQLPSANQPDSEFSFVSTLTNSNDEKQNNNDKINSEATINVDQLASPSAPNKLSAKDFYKILCKSVLERDIPLNRITAYIAEKCLVMRYIGFI